MKLTKKERQTMIQDLLESMEFWTPETLLEYAQNFAMDDLVEMSDEQLKMVYEQHIKSQTIH